MTGAIAVVLSFITGYIALSYEILWYRVIAFASSSRGSSSSPRSLSEFGRRNRRQWNR